MTAIFTKKNIIMILSIIVIGLLIYFILPISIPIILALITALLLEPAVRMIVQRGKVKRNVSVLLVFLMFLLLIGISGYFITTKVVGEVIQLAENAPAYVNEINRVWKDFETTISTTVEDLPKEFVEEVSNQVENFLLNTRDELAGSLNIENVKNIFTNIPNYLVNLLVYLIALFLFMIDLPRLKEKAYSHMTERTAQQVAFMSKRISVVMFGFIKAQLLVSVIIFLAALIGLLLISPEIALIMALIIWVIDVIPLIGSIIVMLPWTLFQFMTGDIALGTKLAILTIVLLIIRRTIEPKVMGTHIGLSPLATLISMYLGLRLFGFLGFFIGPMILIVYNTAREAGIIRFRFKI
ncbi:sporulation integral membrane protein YtvI [Bacillus lacus]|uniref:Sporulation integral membrane protein YtvI n=1 Tax=Metabacillus lacus TaxID=1983721 RepID=A0A7X2IXM0_9BACI|nr:sporulation integral membrane protein YtvI [Metabacillus lacus]MRX71701.1 sporulation integral membrane protein YtvI [Metabacillus lacus]